MNNIIQVLKKVGLFLSGILLIVWGYKVNAANIEAKAKEEKESNKETELQPVVAPPANQVEAETESTVTEPTKKTATPKDSEAKKEAPQNKAKASVPSPAKTSAPAVEKKVEKKATEESAKVEEPKQTVIEKATPEESSGTE